MCLYVQSKSNHFYVVVAVRAGKTVIAWLPPVGRGEEERDLDNPTTVTYTLYPPQKRNVLQYHQTDEPLTQKTDILMYCRIHCSELQLCRIQKMEM